VYTPNLQRVAEAKDIEEVAALAHEIWNEHFPPIIGQAQVDYMLAELQSAPAITRQIRDGGYEYFFIVDGGERVGYLAVVPDFEGSAMQLSKIYLKRGARGRGVGRAILAQIEQECRRCGLRELWLTVNKDNADSIAFYERVGFIITDAMVTDIGGGFVMDDYRMLKRLGRRL
jgi:ribosomal protein S18 acetylase RimI-like enzyme